MARICKNPMNGKRDFGYMDMRFRIWDLYEREKKSKEEKYTLGMRGENGLYSCIWDILSGDILRFKTIREAQRWVLFNHELIGNVYAIGY